MRVLTTNPVCATLALVSVLLVPQLVRADPVQGAETESAAPDVAQAGEVAKPGPVPCEQREVVLDETKAGIKARASCVRASQQVSDARAYLIETARPGFTMARQGPEIAIGRLHPDFVTRLADAIRDAREEGMGDVGIFSAYRPPAFGVGGFSDKFNSLHAYGLAVDMYGIGRPGSSEAKEWHRIAAKHGVVCPYGPRDRAEWNHCQPTSVKIVRANTPLRGTITANGPRDLGTMFDAGTAFMNNMGNAAQSFVASAAHLFGFKLASKTVVLAGKTVVRDEWCDNSKAMKAQAKMTRAERRVARRAARAERYAVRQAARAERRAARAEARASRHAAAVSRKRGKKVHVAKAKTRSHARVAAANAKKSYRRSQARLKKNEGDS